MIWKKKQMGRKTNRIAGLLLAVSLVFGLAGVAAPSVQAASWMDYYLEKVVDWGVMRGDIDGNLEPDRPITRAEFVSMVNRAYGYTEVLPTPFTDISPQDWFYEDICIAYNAGYFAGDSETTASPNALLTREQAAVLVSHNMMLQEGIGETLGFSDSREFEPWSRHRIKAILDAGVMSGYPDNTFKPKEPITRGQVATMLVKAVGTPIQKSGEVSLGGVYGNVTITSPGVKLKDTTIYGDLYVSGGVGLSNVMLENVNVQGEIIVSGAGESEKGEHSVMLRNVLAEKLVMDSMKDKFITLKADGLTTIDTVDVRTGSYLEDVTNDGFGLKQINLDGKSGTQFQLAGNIKDVLNFTQASTVTLAQGIAKEITIDEKAVGANLNLSKDTVVNKVNLDAASTITGSGSISHVNVNVSGTTSSILPDTITVRPGITANVKGEVMDSVTAQESSEDPRLLSGYPRARNIAPTTADLYFKTNKKGVVYWAVTALADGTLDEEALLSPGEYGGLIVLSGTVKATSSNTEFMTKISKLVKDGSYYVSAMLVDNRGLRSPVKITAFTTPDDTVPAFVSGYPTASVVDGEDDEQIVQALVMPNKNCRMYYALLPKGSVAPTTADFKANAVTGNLGYGVVELQKNTPYLVPQINSVYLEEQTEYDLYLWLTDADGRQSAAVKKLTIKTLDRTPPTLQYLSMDNVTASSVVLKYALNEPGTLYWVVVTEGANFYMDPSIHTSLDKMQTEEAKAQIISGINSLKKGSSNANKESTETKFTISGLEAETAYDVYYVAVDKAGNYGIYDASLYPPYTVYTLDNAGPTVVQEFSHDGTNEGQAITPYPDTSIDLVFSENIQGMLDLIGDDGSPDSYKFLEEYLEARSDTSGEAMEAFANMLSCYVKLYEKGETTPVKVRNAENKDDWVLDYRNVRLQMDPSGTGNLILRFPYNGDDPSKSALNLAGGKTYQFRLEGIADTSVAANRMQGVKGITSLPEFTIISAQAFLNKDSATVPEQHDGLDKDGKPDDTENVWYFDMVFTVEPVSHEAMADDILWDLVIWSDSAVDFKVYRQTKDDKGNWDNSTWKQFGDSVISIADGGNVQLGAGLHTTLKNQIFESVNTMEDYRFAIEIVKNGSGGTIRKNWNTPVTLGFTVITGKQNPLRDLGESLGIRKSYDEAIKENDEVLDISVPAMPNLFTMTKTFVDKTPPHFAGSSPSFEEGSTRVNIRVMMDRPNSTFYYLIAPVEEMRTVMEDGSTELNKDNWEILLPESGADVPKYPTYVTTPDAEVLMDDQKAFQPEIKYGKERYVGAVVSFTVEDLLPKTKYVAYFVLEGEAQGSHSQVYAFRFETGEVNPPDIILDEYFSVVNLTSTTDAEGGWMLVDSTTLKASNYFNQPFIKVVATDKKDAFLTEYREQSDTMTVLDALMMNESDKDYTSVFDLYAGVDIRETVRDIILATSDRIERVDKGTFEKKNNTDLKENEKKTLEPKNMFVGNRYYLVATLRHTMGDTYSFKAIGNVRLRDESVPEIVDCITKYTSVIDKDDNKIDKVNDRLAYSKDPNQYIYSGEVQIIFSKKPYISIDEETRDLSTYLKNGSTNSSDYNITDVICSGNAIIVKFANAQVLNRGLLFTDGYICEEYGRNNGKKLALDFFQGFFNPDLNPIEFTAYYKDKN